MTVNSYTYISAVHILGVIFIQTLTFDQNEYYILDIFRVQ